MVILMQQVWDAILKILKDEEKVCNLSASYLHKGDKVSDRFHIMYQTKSKFVFVCKLSG